MGGERPGGEETSDGDVIQRSLATPSAFSVIFDRHFDAVYSYLARRIGPTQAEDLVASTFTVAFERRRRFRREVETARPWLLGIATNLLRNEFRAERRSLEALGRLGREVVTVEVQSPEPADLGSLLADLDPDQRDVLLLYAWEDLSYEQISAALGIPVGTVRSRLARARAHLRAGLSTGDDDRRSREASG